MGLHAGLGLRYMISEIEDKINSGDVILIIPEYGYFFNSVLNGNNTLLGMTLFFPEGIHYLEYQQLINVIMKFPHVLQRRFSGFIRNIYFNKKYNQQKKNTNCIYCRETFNHFGDGTNHLDFSTGKFNDKIVIPTRYAFGNEAVFVMNSFYQKALKKNVKVYHFYPAVPQYIYNRNKANLTKFHNWLKKRLKIPMLSSPDSFVLPKKYFYDTLYHLKRQGREKRTNSVLLKLKNVLKKNNVD